MITVFSTPKPFRGHSDVIQRNALMSWKLLHPDAEVILFGDEEGTAEVCKELGIRHEPEVRRNEYGTKYLNYIFDRANELAGHKILCYANCDIMFGPEFRSACELVAKAHPKFLLIGRRWDTDIVEPWKFDEKNWDESLRSLALQKGKQAGPSWVDYFCFSRDLYYKKMPPFLIGRHGWDPWVTWFAHDAGATVIDGSQSIVAVHQNHDYLYLKTGEVPRHRDAEVSYNWSLGTSSRWHYYDVHSANEKVVDGQLAPNRWFWWGPISARIRGTGQQAWFAFLKLTRPIRHPLGLKQTATEPGEPVAASTTHAVETASGSSRSIAKAKKWLREPLVHFLILGALLFLYFQWKGNSRPESRRIVISAGEIQHLEAGFARTWQRPPSANELKTLIDDYVKEEIATREAVSMGLDQNDTIIRRRLRQKLEYLSEDLTAASAPTDAELRAWLSSHPDAFQGEPQVAFRQVYVNASQRGESAAQNEAKRLLAVLRSGGPSVATVHLGDASLLPPEQALEPLSEVTKTFGQEFTGSIEKLETGKWSGPVESAFGLHLVLVSQKTDPPAANLEEIRPQVEREVQQEKRKAQLEAMYQTLLKKYSVTIEFPSGPSPSSPQK